MRSEEIKLLGDLTGQIEWLHSRAMEKMVNEWPSGRVGVNPQAAWSVQSAWAKRVDAFVAKNKLSGRVHDILDTAIGTLIESANSALASTAGYSENERISAVRDAGMVWRLSWNGRAKRIAITETTRIISESRLSSPEAQAPGVWKRWVTVEDDRVRPSHAIVHGQTVPVQQPFNVGGAWIMYPGDPSAPPQEAVGCRCELDIVKTRRG